MRIPDPLAPYASLVKWLLAAGLLAAVVFGLSRFGAARFAAGQADVQRRWDAAIERGKKEVERLRGEAGKVTIQTRTVYVDRVHTIREKGDAIIQQVPVYVPSGSCDLPGGFRVLHDAAASGSSLPEAGPDPHAAAVPAQDAAATVAANYAACHETAARLSSLQAWVRGIDALAPGGE